MPTQHPPQVASGQWESAGCRSEPGPSCLESTSVGGGSGAHSQAPPGGRCGAPAGQGEPWLLPGLSQHGTSQCTGTMAREGFTCFPIIANVRKEKAAWLLPL